MSDFDLVVCGKLVTDTEVIDDGWLAVRQGNIAAVGRGIAPRGRDLLDARGLWVLPGVIDGQVHSGSQAGQEGLARASRAAAAGGVTVMVDMPYDDPEPVACRQRLDEKIAEVRRDCHVDVALFGTLNQTHGLQAAAGLLEGGVCAFKFSTFEAAPVRFPRLEEDVLEAAFALIAPTGLACAVHNQMQELTRRNIARLREAGDTGWDAFARAHPPLVETLASAIIYELGTQTGARAHVVHASTARSFELCNLYRAAGHAVSIETCVQYLMLSHEQHARRWGAKLKHYPPIRPQAEVERLWTFLARDECTFVSSDHVSWSLDRKAHADIFANASGGPGLETLLPALWTGCHRRGLPPSLVVRQLARNPARHFLLDDRKGALLPGYDADFVLLEPVTYRYDPGNSFSAVQWSGFAGMEFDVRVAGTWCRGEAVYDGRQIVNPPGGPARFLRPRQAR